jgi:hypothetical protein
MPTLVARLWLLWLLWLLWMLWLLRLLVAGKYTPIQRYAEHAVIRFCCAMNVHGLD